MSCTINLRTQGLNGADTGGTWVYNGHNASSESGPFTVGAFNPTLTGDDPSVDHTSAPKGYHSYTYSGTDCNGVTVSQDVIVYVADGPEAGEDGAVTACESDTGLVIDLFASLNGTPQTGGTWTHTSGTLDPNSSFDAGAGTVTLNSHPPATLVFTYTVTPQNIPAGYSIQNCPNCADDTNTVTITIEADFTAGTPNSLAVCNA